MKLVSRYTCASLLVFGALATSAAFAEVRDLATVTFNQPVEVGNSMLPAGNYRIDATGSGAFIVQSENGQQSALVMGSRVDVARNEDAKTHVVLKNDGPALRLDQLVIAGEGTAYQFGK